MIPLPVTSDVVRRVLRHDGAHFRDVADLEGLSVDTVRSVRQQRGRNAIDGSRYVKPQAPSQRDRRSRRDRPADRVDFGELMRANTGVCV